MHAPFFERILGDLNHSVKCRVAVPFAQDEACAYAVGRAIKMGILSATLIGNPDLIRKLYGDETMKNGIQIVSEADQTTACKIAVQLVKEGKADILMKGLVPTSTLLKAVLNSKDGIKKNPLLSHLLFFEAKAYPGVRVMTDAAVNISPDADALSRIVENSAEALGLFERRPLRIALLAANEKVSDKVLSTVLARKVSQGFSEREDILVEGPISLDLALSPESAEIKKYNGRIRGNADIFVVPRIEAGNAFYKSLHYYSEAALGGIVFGAKCPVVLTSRADNNDTKFNSLLLGSVLWQRALPAPGEPSKESHQ